MKTSFYLLATVLISGVVAEAQAPVPQVSPTAEAGVITNVVETRRERRVRIREERREQPKVEVEVEETVQLADTGGAPLLMALSGLALAGGAFGLRRKLK